MITRTKSSGKSQWWHFLSMRIYKDQLVSQWSRRSNMASVRHWYLDEERRPGKTWAQSLSMLPDGLSMWLSNAIGRFFMQLQAPRPKWKPLLSETTLTSATLYGTIKASLGSKWVKLTPLCLAQNTKELWASLVLSEHFMLILSHDLIAVHCVVNLLRSRKQSSWPLRTWQLYIPCYHMLGIEELITWYFSIF